MFTKFNKRNKSKLRKHNKKKIIRCLKFLITNGVKNYILKPESIYILINLLLKIKYHCQLTG